MSITATSSASIIPLHRPPATADIEADDGLPLGAWQKLEAWRVKLDGTPKLKKRDAFERAADDLFLEAETQHNLGAVQRITDAIYQLGCDHTGLDDDSIQFVMVGAKGKVERLSNRHAENGGGGINPVRIEATTDPPAPGLDIFDAGDDIGLPPPREWLLGNQFCRRFLSSVVAPGAVGKTALRIAQLLSLAVKRSLTGQHVFMRCRVLLLSFEDGRDELRRRIAAACIHHGIGRNELKGWLYYATPKGIKLAELKNCRRERGELEKLLRVKVQELKPDIIGLDPFIKIHALEENDTGAMDFVCDLLATLADEFNVAVDAPHHSRKGIAAPGDSDTGRGASSIRDAGRLVYTLTPMSEDEAKQFNISQADRRQYIRLDSAKVNITRPAQTATWFKLVSVTIGNGTEQYPAGDEIQTVEPWGPPDTWAGLSSVALNAALTEIDTGMSNGQRYSDAGPAKTRAAWRVIQKRCPDRNETQCREIINTWVRNGVLFNEEYDDPIERKPRQGLRLDSTKRPS